MEKLRPKTKIRSTWIFKEGLNLEVSSDEIDIVHRTGIRRERKSRQILVKFKEGLNLEVS